MAARLAVLRSHISATSPPDVAAAAGSAGPKVARVAIVTGVGPVAGLGGAIAARFAKEGYHVFAMGRTAAKLAATCAAIRAAGGRATPWPMKSIAASRAFSVAGTDQRLMEEEVVACFDAAAAAGPIEVVVQNHGPNMPPPTGGDMRNMARPFVEFMWKNNFVISFLVGREAARRMVPQGRGTVLFTGSTASIRGRPPFAAFAQAKGGVRFLAQSMAREYGNQGIHVAHVMVDGMLGGDRLLTMGPFGIVGWLIKKWRGSDGMVDIKATAELFWRLHAQPRGCWTHEAEVRPYNEAW